MNEIEDLKKQYLERKSIQLPGTGRNFGLIDISSKREDAILFAPGAPMTAELLENFILFLAIKTKKRILCPLHPNLGFKTNPKIQRPAALLEIFQMTDSVSLVGHSYGGMDIVRMLMHCLENNISLEKLENVILINSAGMAKNSFFGHVSRFSKYIKSGKTEEETEFLKKWNELCQSQGLWKTLVELFDLANSRLEGSLKILKNAGIKISVICTDDDLLQCSISDNVVFQKLSLETKGNHNGIIFNPDVYGANNLLDLILKS